MIKKSIIPDKIGNYYIIPTTIVGIDVGKTHIHATKLYARGRSITIQESVREQLPPGTLVDYSERAAAVIKKITEQLAPYDELHTALSSSLVIFKELTLPFVKSNKIELVVGFEVEPLLPFSLDDAIIDFIITKQSSDSSDVLIAAVQKQHVAAHLALFQQAGVDPAVVTIDMFALYGMYEKMPHHPTTESVVLIDYGSFATHLVYLHRNQIRFIRSLPTGIIDQAKKMSDALNSSNGQVMGHLIRFGLTNEMQEQKYAATAHEVFTQFLNTVGFTIRSFATQVSSEGQDISLVLLGEGATIKGLPELTHKTLNLPTTLLDPLDLVSTPAITFEHKNSFDPAAAISLATALPSPITANFNVRKKEFERIGDRKLLERQLLIVASLTLLVLISTFVGTTLQLRKLSSAIHEAQQEVITLVEKRFGTPADGQDLEEVIQTVQRSVQEEEKLWFSLANPARLSFLHYLLELTNRIDKEGLGFVINSIKIADDTITLQAHVRDYTALSFLEKELRQSPLFSYVEGQDNPDFTMKIRLAKNPRRRT